VLEGFKSELDLAGMKIPCAVISGPKGVQRVLTENGITYAILGERSGASKRLKKAASEGGALLPLFVAPSQLKPFISKELEDGPLKPIDYQDGDRIVRGYGAAVLVVVCNIWLSARQAGALQAQQLRKAHCETGIMALVDEATGPHANGNGSDRCMHPPKTQGKGSLGGLCQGGRLFPVPWQEVRDAAGRMAWKASEDIGKPGARIDAVHPTGLNQGVDGSSPRSARSAALFDRQARPSVRNKVMAGQRFRL
jgi:hypothetical protein